MINNTNDSGSRQSSQLSITSSHHRRPNGLHHSNSNSSSNHHRHVNKNNSLNPSIWTTNTSRSSSKSNFTSGSNDFHFLQTNDINTTTKSNDVQNGSTSKLLPYADDQSNTQVSRLILLQIYIIIQQCIYIPTLYILSLIKPDRKQKQNTNIA